MSSPEFAEAIRHHQAGRLHEAQTHYRKALRASPADPEAMHLLGVLCHVTGRSNEAIALIKGAIAMAPACPSYFNNLANVLSDRAQLREAVAGALAALKVDPVYAEARNTLGNLLKAFGRWNEAAANYRVALLAKPDLPEAHYNLANLLVAHGRAGDAIPCFRHALALQPELPEAHNSLGNAFRQLQMPERTASYRMAVLLRPGFAEGYSNLGNALHDLGRPEDAGKSYRTALKLKPDLAEAHSNLGTLLSAQQRHGEATMHFRAALCCKPDYAEAYNNFGNAQAAQGLPMAAMANLQRGLTIQPDYAGGLNNLGNVLKDQGDLDAAVSCYRQALALRPGFLQAHSNLLMALSFHPGSSPQEYLEEARRYGAKVAAAARPFHHSPPSSPWGGERPLRVGLVSGDLRRHPVGFFLEGILGHLDRSRFQISAYATNSRFDDLSTRIRPYFEAWTIIGGVSDADAARRIYDDGIDVLIDLAGHTANNRLEVFAWKPAPVQCSWLGYFASTGLAEMDYLLTDPVSAPPTVGGQFTESLWYLPDTRLCFTPPEEPAIPLAPPPALHNGFVTFGCFQNLAKLNDGVLASWGRIFRALPSARLRLQNNQVNCPQTCESLRQRLHSAGLTPSQIIIEGSRPRRDYLAAHGEVDIILDTFPYPGGTTTCEALWMGVPTVTLAGTTLLARQGASLLAAAGLTDWIATDADDYCRCALSHAADMNRLAALRAGLRECVQTSPLFDARRFAGNLEQALTGMWQRAVSSTTHLANPAGTSTERE